MGNSIDHHFPTGVETGLTFDLKSKIQSKLLIKWNKLDTSQIKNPRYLLTHQTFRCVAKFGVTKTDWEWTYFNSHPRIVITRHHCFDVTSLHYIGYDVNAFSAD